MAARQLAAQTVPTTGGNVVVTSSVGAPGGVAGLDGTAKVPHAQVPTPKISVGVTAPPSPAVGDVWIDTN